MPTLLYVGGDAQRWLEPARRLVDAQAMHAGVTSFGDLLVARWLGRDAAAVRRSFGGFWAQFRALVQRLPPRLPTIWEG
jgi:urease accessory protein UreH